MVKLTKTFLLTDVEKSTKLSEQHGAAIDAVRGRHVQLIRQAVAANVGRLYKTVGDGTQSAFDNASQALSAAIEAQLAHQKEASDIILCSRMALHTCQADYDEKEDDYSGVAFNRAARLLSAGHGGQILVSLATSEQLRYHLPPGVTLKDFGQHRLKDLTEPEHIFQVLNPDLRHDFPELRTLDRWPNNLSVQSTPLIGREREVAEVRGRLLRADTRLLTLTGPGGIGKTRLALQAAAEMLDDFPDGVFFINLVPLIDPNLVVPTIAYTLGLREAGAQPIAETLVDYLKDKKLLLVLDNFEQVVASAPQVADLLKSAPDLKVLVTSRASLRLSMEHEYPVPPLPIPDPTHLPTFDMLSQYDAVALFIQRAQAIKPDFMVNNQNAPAVAEICHRLEGIPLAIELAAARIKTLPPQSLLSKLGSRLKLLTGGARDLHTRQQTLRNTIEWSYDLLTEGEKQLFRRMAVFRGGRTLEAAEAVRNSKGDTSATSGNSTQVLEIDVLDGITSLVDKSLMYAIEGASGEPRYWMLETIQEYAWEKLQESGEAEALQRLHALYFMALAEEAEPHLMGKEQAAWLERLEEEHGNIRAALRWARKKGETGDNEAAEIGLRIAGAIWRFWLVRGYFSEGREQLERSLSVGQSSARARAKALNGAGNLAQNQGDYAAARSLNEKSVALSRELGDKRNISSSLINLGIVAWSQEDYRAARSLFEESLALSRELGDKSRISYSLNGLGMVAWSQGDYAAARSLHEESLALRSELGDKRGIAQSLGNLGMVAWSQGDAGGAGQLFRESLQIARELGGKRPIAIRLAGLGAVAAVLGYEERGARLLGVCDALLEATGGALDPDDRVLYERGVAIARAQLGEQEFTRAWAEGRAMSMEQAIEYALGDDSN